ncbi:hypothetical protein [Pseudomonas abieticivorans]|uniref:bpX5 domain-containing protein n=1 Tax=Pseudomonas abieticivorans TaxID=2931382 RepID=UPI0020BE5083|nr:hypothetical protein [Pseudomonas sp. PIA16]
MPVFGQDWQWQRRGEPLAPRAAVAWGEVARQLHARLQQLPAGARKRLQATASHGLLVVTGESADLPWVDGIQYAAPAPQAPGLWLPTQWQPDACSELLLQALSARFPRQPLLLWREPALVIPLDRQLPLSLEHHLPRIQTLWGAHAAT